ARQNNSRSWRGRDSTSSRRCWRGLCRRYTRAGFRCGGSGVTRGEGRWFLSVIWGTKQSEHRTRAPNHAPRRGKTFVGFEVRSDGETFFVRHEVSFFQRKFVVVGLSHWPQRLSGQLRPHLSLLRTAARRRDCNRRVS